MSRRPRRRRPEQLELPRPRTRGGARPGAGRPKTGRAGVAHRPRPLLASRFPVHVTLKARKDAPRLRLKRSADALRAAMGAGCDKQTFRLVHYSIQPEHVHLVCEAKDAVCLSRGLQGLEIRMARALNRAHGRRGRVWADRYHERQLKTPREVRSCLVYVLGNFRHHGGEDKPALCIDALSSSRWFDGYREKVPPPPPDEPSVVTGPRTWLLTKGWRVHGLISVAEGPRS